MIKVQNDRFLRALKRQPVDHTPVWIMRQAGRYLPEYRKVREQAQNFLTLCKTPELACEVTLQPLRRYPLDAAIIFSDILTIPDAMGLGLHFIENEGPKFSHPLQTVKDIMNLSIPDVEQELAYVMEAIKLTKQELHNKVPLIGFSGSPWTLATYMLENGSTKTFSKIKRWLFAEPATLHHLLSLLTDSIINYLNAQIMAGAQAVMIFDTWGGVLTPRDYRDFSLHYMAIIVNQLIRKSSSGDVPIILFTKNGGQWLEPLAATGCDAVGIDWTTDLSAARERVGHRVALQGNMDPAALYGSPAMIEAEIQTILASYGHGSGHIFNLGHGIMPDINPDHVSVMIESVQKHSRQYHAV